MTAEPLVQLWNYLSAFDKWLLATIGSGFSACGGYLYKLVREAHHANTNCLPTIQKNTGETRDAIIELNSYLKAKVEDGKL